MKFEHKTDEATHSTVGRGRVHKQQKDFFGAADGTSGGCRSGAAAARSARLNAPRGIFDCSRPHKSFLLESKEIGAKAAREVALSRRWAAMKRQIRGQRRNLARPPGRRRRRGPGGGGHGHTSMGFNSLVSLVSSYCRGRAAEEVVFSGFGLKFRENALFLKKWRPIDQNP